LGDVRAVEPLTLTLTDPITHVRAAAAVALGKIRDPRAAESLQLARKDTHATVRQAAETALACLRDGPHGDGSTRAL
jgi:HEAT repeat protein